MAKSRDLESTVQGYENAKQQGENESSASIKGDCRLLRRRLKIG
jgi:hypothetical protein